MNFNDYQEQTHKTNIYPKEHMLEALTLGLCSEAGEVASKVKKFFRDAESYELGYLEEAIEKEIGDLTWYCSELATHLGLSLDEIARKNIKKLKDRQERGVLGGSGDNR